MKKLATIFFKKAGDTENNKNTGNTGRSGIKYFPVSGEKVFSEVDLWNIHRKRKTTVTRRWVL